MATSKEILFSISLGVCLAKPKPLKSKYSPHFLGKVKHNGDCGFITTPMALATQQLGRGGQEQAGTLPCGAWERGGTPKASGICDAAALVKTHNRRSSHGTLCSVSGFSTRGMLARLFCQKTLTLIIITLKSNTNDLGRNAVEKMCFGSMFGQVSRSSHRS